MTGYSIPTASPADEPTVTISVNEQWWSFLFGGLSKYAYPNVWNGTEEERQAAVEKVYELMAIGGIEMPEPCDTCPEELVYDAATQSLGYMSGGTFNSVINLTNLNVSNSYGVASSQLPPVSDEAKFCYAAHKLVEDWADDLKDIYEGILSATIVSNTVIKSLVSGLTLGLTPADEVVDIISTGTTTALSWITTNINDPDALDFAAEKIYCYILEHHPDIDSMWDELPWDESLPPLGSVGLSFDFGEWVDFVWGAASGEMTGWLILAYAAFGVQSWGVWLGLNDPTSIEVAEYANRAQHFEDRDCDGWCSDCTPNNSESGGDFPGYSHTNALTPEISEDSRWSTPNTNAGNWWGATWLEPVLIATATVYTWDTEKPSNAQLEYWNETLGEWVTVHSYAGTDYPFTFENTFDVPASRWRILITSTGWVSFGYVKFTCQEE